MADLNDAFVAASQHDDRLITFVVHVPTMGAKQHHAEDSIPLLDGPRVNHYWEETGIIGQHYTDVMDVRIYVWDFWMIYGPDAAWDGILPPVPDYYEHQLGIGSRKSWGFPKERILDAERFWAVTQEYLAKIDAQQLANTSDPELSRSEQLADGVFIPKVGQPRNMAVRQHIMGRGGFKNLQRIESIEQHGRIEANGQSYLLTTLASRPNSLQRSVTADTHVSVAESNEDGNTILDASAERGLPVEFEKLLLGSFDFDGPLIEWPKKGHKLKMSGMLKIGDVLAWRLHLAQQDGTAWYLYINSHGGALVRADLLNAEGEAEYVIRNSDFRETSGFSFPHRIEYLDSAGRSLAVETIDDIEVEMAPFKIKQENVAH